ncbi:hypothetical protein D3C71_1558980 [compost metagenome]
MININIVADICLLIALAISAGCSAWVDGYVKQKKIETIGVAASCASTLQLLLCIVLVVKIAVAMASGGVQ